MRKLVENSSRDAQIAFANELSLICDKADINVWVNFWQISILELIS